MRLVPLRSSNSINLKNKSSPRSLTGYDKFLLLKVNYLTSSMAEHRSPEPLIEVRILGEVPSLLIKALRGFFHGHAALGGNQGAHLAGRESQLAHV